MKKTIILYFSFAVVFFSACQKSMSDDFLFSSVSQEAEKKSYFVPQEKAIEEVNTLLNVIDEGSTRGKHGNRAIESVAFLHSQVSPVRSETEPFSFEGIYVVSFENDEGFALASADSRTTPVFCVVDKGTFSLDENIAPPLAVFLGNLDKAMKDTLSPLYKENVKTDTTDELYTRSTTYGDWQIVSQVTPKISTLWHEAYPYNYEFPLSGDDLFSPPFYGKIRAGSSTIAVGQILAAMEPQIPGPLSYSWSGIKNPEQALSTTAGFLKEIGMGIFSQWGLAEVTCDLGTVRDYLRDNWYLTVEKESDADSHVSDAVSFLAEAPIKNNLIYSRADSERRTFLGITVGYSGDYAWAVDGCVIRQRTKTTTNIFGHTSTSMETQNLLHCNMGFPTDAYNGYYVNTDFTSPLDGPLGNAMIFESLNLVYRNKFLYISK